MATNTCTVIQKAQREFDLTAHRLRNTVRAFQKFFMAALHRHHQLRLAYFDQGRIKRDRLL